MADCKGKTEALAFSTLAWITKAYYVMKTIGVFQTEFVTTPILKKWAPFVLLEEDVS